ncbi:hypothetical protein M0Q50_06835 [bacterium]|jgi:hypothetical protein|nr:hypothetical protein [bacterium]
MTSRPQAFGGYNELDFLTNANIKNGDNTASIFKNDGSDEKVVFKISGNKGTNNIKNYYNTNTNKNNDANPYFDLIANKNSIFNTIPSMKLVASDFVYLIELGLYPINRMWILRRFPEGAIVPNNLTECGDNPISTMVGWIRPSDEKFFNFGMNEGWTTINKRVDEVLFEIMQKEFGIDMSAMVSLPGFTQGLLFSFLKQMGVTGKEYGLFDIPLGDPNLLTEGATRLTDASTSEQNLKSNISFDLVTTYEQKFIGDVDPGSAMLDILSNVKKMATSDIKYIFSADSDIIKKLIAANRSEGAEISTKWVEFCTTVIDKFVIAVTDVVTSAITYATEMGQGGTQSPAGETEDQKKVREEKEEQAKEDAKDNPPKEESSTAAATIAGAAFSKAAGALTGDVMSTILASTVRKWRWPLQGSIGASTGVNTAPWHLTIGNPNSPFFSIGNMIVKTCDVEFANEFSFNDMPTRIKVSLKVEQGRNLGGNEILMAFNNQVERKYTPPKA